ncbi:hypothetical protein [Streptomyces sp. NPDC059092]|uniref:hypothetical protein n=1 Tax=Streptomyces sp. NPDC059092 TaxID=3346725 RepID=UPI0036AA1BCF
MPHIGPWGGCSASAPVPPEGFGGDSPRLHVETVADTELVAAAPSTGEFAGRTTVHVDELVDAVWIATPSPSSEPLLGVWPGLPSRPAAHRPLRARLADRSSIRSSPASV